MNTNFFSSQEEKVIKKRKKRKNTSFFFFKRIIPLLLIGVGIYSLFITLVQGYQIFDNVVYQSMVVMGLFFLILMGVYFFSKESSLGEIYTLYYYLFFGISVMSIILLMKNFPYENFFEFLKQYFYYGIAFTATLLFWIAARKHNTT